MYLSIYRIYIAPFQGYYSEALPAQGAICLFDIRFYYGCVPGAQAIVSAQKPSAVKATSTTMVCYLDTWHTLHIVA